MDEQSRQLLARALEQQTSAQNVAHFGGHGGAFLISLFSGRLTQVKASQRGFTEAFAGEASAVGGVTSEGDGQ